MSDELLEIWGDLEEGQLAEFIDNAPVMLHSIDAEGTLIKVNNFWAKRLRYEPSDMIGKRAVDFMTERSRKYTLTHTLPEFLRVGKASEILYEFVQRDGSIVPVYMSAIAKHNVDGSFSHSLAVISEAPASKFEGSFPKTDSLDATALSPLERLRNVTQEVRVLVAEDNEMNRKVIHAFLHPTTVQATYVLNGEEALEKLSNEAFDAALIDIEIPILNGAEVVRRYRDLETTLYRRRIPIIACTALCGNDSINRFMDAGFSRYLPKPISVVAFADCLDWIVARQTDR